MTLRATTTRNGWLKWSGKVAAIALITALPSAWAGDTFFKADISARGGYRAVDGYNDYRGYRRHRRAGCTVTRLWGDYGRFDSYCRQGRDGIVWRSQLGDLQVQGEIVRHWGRGEYLVEVGNRLFLIQGYF